MQQKLMTVKNVNLIMLMYHKSHMGKSQHSSKLILR